jgi:hypothetical protein
MMEQGGKRLFTKIRLEGKLGQALLDSGAAVTCFGKHFL